MRYLIPTLSILFYTLTWKSQATSIVIANTGPLSGASNSDKLFTFQMPTGLKSVTIYGRAYSRQASGDIKFIYKQVNDPGDVPSDNDLNQPLHATVHYPSAGNWDLLVHGVSYYSQLGCELVGIPDTMPFSRHAGAYGAIFENTNFVTIYLIGSGAFTGKVYLDGLPFSFKGKFDGNGDASSDSPVPYTLHSDPSPSANGIGTNVITGTISGHSITARHTAYKPGDKAIEAGKYTLLLTPNQTDNTLPAGTSYAVAVISNRGQVRMVGKLADGTSLSAGGPLYGGPNGKNQFLLYNPTLYRSNGLLASIVTMETLNDSDCDGSVTWIKPSTTGAYYNAAFDTTLALAGSRYGARAHGLIAVDFPAGTNNIAVNVTGGGITANLTETATVSPFNKVTITGPNSKQLKITVNSAAGAFTGSFVDSGASKPVKFGGLLYQNADNPQAAGFFLGPILNGTGLSGNVSLTPAP